MKTASEVPTPIPLARETWANAVRRRPGTRLGWAAVALAGLFGLMWIINSMVFMPLFMYGRAASPAWMPYYGIALVLCGLAAGLTGLLAVVRHERSGLVLATLVPGLCMLTLLAGEFLVPH